LPIFEAFVGFLVTSCWSLIMKSLQFWSAWSTVHQNSHIAQRERGWCIQGTVESAVSAGLSSAYCLVLWGYPFGGKCPFLQRLCCPLPPLSLLWAPFIVSMYVPTYFCFLDTTSVIFVASHIDGYVGSPIALLVIFGEGWYKFFCFFTSFLGHYFWVESIVHEYWWRHQFWVIQSFSRVPYSAGCKTVCSFII